MQGVPYIVRMSVVQNSEECKGKQDGKKGRKVTEEMNEEKRGRDENERSCAKEKVERGRMKLYLLEKRGCEPIPTLRPKPSQRSWERKKTKNGEHSSAHQPPT